MFERLLAGSSKFWYLRQHLSRTKFQTKWKKNVCSKIMWRKFGHPKGLPRITGTGCWLVVLGVNWGKWTIFNDSHSRWGQTVSAHSFPMFVDWVSNNFETNCLLSGQLDKFAPGRQSNRQATKVIWWSHSRPTARMTQTLPVIPSHWH